MRKKTLAAALAAALTLTLAACSLEGGPGGDSPGGDTPGGGATNGTGGENGNGGGSTGPHILNQIGWGGTTWNPNFNIFSPTGVNANPGTAYIFEPLIRSDRTSAGEFLPHLAESWEFNEDGTQLTFTLRDDVLWSDGEQFTSEDVKYTWDLVLSGETPQAYPFTSVEAPDDFTVVVNYDSETYQDLVGFTVRSIVPKHEWESQNVREWTNPEPVGTGPAVLASHSPQQIVFDIRDDWWGGPSNGLDQLALVAVEGDAMRAQIISNQVQFGTFGWQNAQSEFVDLDPENNFYGFYPVGNSDGMIFNTTEAPYDDVHVRRALRAALDLETAAQVVAVGYSVPTPAGIDPIVYSELLADEHTHVFDPELAQQELEAGGWTVENGQLVKDGESYSLRYDVYQPYSEWVNNGTVVADQWRENLGLDVSVNQMADAPFTEASSTGNFGILSGSPVSGSTPYQVFNTLAEPNFTPIGEQAIYNYGRWQNDEYDTVIAELASIEPGSDDDRVRELVVRAQEIITEEAPFIAVATAGWKAVLNGTDWTNFPVPGEDNFAPNGTLPADAALTIMSIQPK